jgi:hypothetical protein
MLAHAFVVRRRLETGANRTDLSSFEKVIRQIVQESAVQGLMEDKGCDRQRAEELAEYIGSVVSSYRMSTSSGVSNTGKKLQPTL